MSTPPPPPPPHDDLEATVAMPRVEPPPPPQRRQIDPAVVEPRPVQPTVIPQPAQVVVQERPRPDIGHPFGYVCARFFAFFIDVTLVSVVVTSLAYSLIAFNPITGLPTTSPEGFDVTFALGVGIALVYVWLCEALFGTTIAKLVLRLHVYAMRGGSVGLGRAFVRGLLRPIDLLVVGGVMALLPGHRRIGDYLGGTIVARSRMGTFGTILGWILLLIVGGLPVIITGPVTTFRSLVAFWQFLPGIVAQTVLFGENALRLVVR